MASLRALVASFASALDADVVVKPVDRSNEIHHQQQWPMEPRARAKGSLGWARSRELGAPKAFPWKNWWLFKQTLT